MPRPRTDYAQLIREALTPNLNPHEEVRWSAAVTHFKAPAPVMFLLGWSLLLPMFGPLVAMALTKFWYVGITPERVLFGHVARPFVPDPTGVIAVPLGDVTVGRRHHGELLIANPPAGVPRAFRLARGFDLDMVAALLATPRQPVTAAVAPAAVPTLPPAPQG